MKALTIVINYFKTDPYIFISYSSVQLLSEMMQEYDGSDMMVWERAVLMEVMEALVVITGGGDNVYGSDLCVGGV